MPVNFLQHRISIASNAPYKSIISKNGTKTVNRNHKMPYSIFIPIILIFLLTYMRYDIKNESFNHKYDNFDNNFDTFNTENSYTKIIKKSNNFTSRYTNGNTIQLNKLKIMQCNKGNSNFETNIHNIQSLIQKHCPDILCISEANIKTNFTFNLNHFPGYKLILNLQYYKIGISRNCILINDRIDFLRRNDLENEVNCDIWLQIKMGGKHILVCGSYRQWSLLKAMSIKNSNSTKLQEERYAITLDGWQRALDEKRDTIFITDDNIDSNDNSDLNKNFKLHNIHNLLHDFMTSNDITQHNHLDTRHVRHQQPSCIDHIYSNVSNKLTDIMTNRTNFSDHSYLTAIYNTKEQIYNPKFIKTRNHRNLNKEALQLAFKQSNINSLFNHSDPNIIADILQLEMGTIINTLSPSKITQYKANYTPYIDDKTIKIYCGTIDGYPGYMSLG